MNNFSNSIRLSAILLLFCPTIVLASNCRDNNPKQVSKALGIKLNEATSWETCWDLEDNDVQNLRDAGVDSSSAVKCEKTGTIIDKKGYWILNKSNNKPVDLIPRSVRSCPEDYGCLVNSDSSKNCTMDESGKSMTCQFNKFVYYKTEVGNIPVDTWILDKYRYKCTDSDDFF